MFYCLLSAILVLEKNCVLGNDIFMALKSMAYQVSSFMILFQSRTLLKEHTQLVVRNCEEKNEINLKKKTTLYYKTED